MTIISSLSESSLYQLGVAPSPDQVHQFIMKNLTGWTHTIIGQSVMGQNISIYYYDNMIIDCNPPPIEDDSNNTKKKVILYLSLEHGNEPMGLMSLLATVELISSSSNSTMLCPSSHPSTIIDTNSSRNSNNPSVRVIVFPIVNIDAYTLNRFYKQGIVRQNLAKWQQEDDNTTKDESVATTNDVISSILSKYGPGYDLNRDYPNPQQPESQAIKNVLEQYHVTHALGFHSMKHKRRPRCLIYPYASGKYMPLERETIYQNWSTLLNQNPSPHDSLHSFMTGSVPPHDSYDNNHPQPYQVGTSLETVGYAASGTSLDFFDEYYNIFSFVIEAIPPCQGRWCLHHLQGVIQESYFNGRTGYRFFQLVRHFTSNNINISSDVTRKSSSSSESSIIGLLDRAQLYPSSKVTLQDHTIAFYSDLQDWYDEMKESLLVVVNRINTGSFFDHSVFMGQDWYIALFMMQWIICCFIVLIFRLFRHRRCRTKKRSSNQNKRRFNYIAHQKPLEQQKLQQRRYEDDDPLIQHNDKFVKLVPLLSSSHQQRTEGVSMIV
jgi:hypothetical protein